MSDAVNDAMKWAHAEGKRRRAEIALSAEEAGVKDSAAYAAGLAEGERKGLERAAGLNRTIYMNLVAHGPVCQCGNGRMPVGAWGRACDDYEAAIRALASEFDATGIKTMGEKPTEYQIETVRKNGGNQAVAFLHAMWADLRAAAPAFPESDRNALLGGFANFAQPPSRNDLIAIAKEISGLPVALADGNGVLDYVMTVGAPGRIPSDDCLSRVKEAIEAARPIGVRFTVRAFPESEG